VAVPGGGRLLLLEDQPGQGEPRAWVLLVHGLGGNSSRPGVRRLALALQAEGFGVWRLNLRGAGAGRSLATGTYAAACNSDLLPVLAAARRRAAGLPLLGTGLSLGGTVLLNALLEQPDGLDALACVSSPLDLAACAARIDAPRNRLYQRVLLGGLIRQTLADHQPLPSGDALRAIRSIRQFDTVVTAPRWGYATVEHYYRQASPLPGLSGATPLPPILLLHARDDPWVPAAPVLRLQQQPPARLDVCVPSHGGHNGFHAAAPWPRAGGASWADRWAVGWLAQRGG
jgi:predicted alpha/beta-fold hydrolase